MSSHGLKQYLAEARRSADEALDRFLPTGDSPPLLLHEAMRYSVFAGGKRVRPVLVLMAGESFGANREMLLPAAAAMEMIHTFSLIHDDLPALDDDDLRRGRATVHRRYDEATAILAGDALLNQGLQLVAARPAEVAAEVRAAAVVWLAQAIGTFGMIGGQMADLEAEKNWPEDAEGALEEIHRLKTGALIRVSVRLGGLYAGVDEADDHRLNELGERIGLLFQIRDDILDVEGTAAALGKTVGKDARARKLTYPSLHGLEASKKLLDGVRREALELASELPGELFSSFVRMLAERDR